MPAQPTTPDYLSEAPPTTLSPDLWDSLSLPSLAWARQNPHKLMGFIMVAQIDFPELAEMLR